MNILRARNSKGIQLIGIGENTAECCSTIMQSAVRCNAEQCEVEDLLRWITDLLVFEHLIPHKQFDSSSEFWRITAR